MKQLNLLKMQIYNEPMKKLLIVFLGVLALSSTSNAQNGDSIYVMRLGNSVCMMPKADVDSIVLNETSPTPDTVFFMRRDTIVYRRAISQIDSIIFYNPFINGIKIETIAVTGGQFTMGSPTTELGRKYDEIEHQVILSNYSMGKYEVSNTEFAAFLNARSIGHDGIDTLGNYPTRILVYDWRYDPYPWAPKPADMQASAPMRATAQDYYPWGMKFENNQWQSEPGSENYPAIFVTWYGAAEFAEFIGGRLPSEAQWEYACRAGTTTPFNTGDCISDADANYYWKNSYGTCDTSLLTAPNKPMPVNSYSPNPWGFFNMHGNVLEWCSDWYTDKIPTETQVDPEGPSRTYTKVYRGGFYQTSANYSRSAFRDANGPLAGNAAIGFRIAIASE